MVGEAADGKQAVGLAARLAPDVVLMDVRMPVMDGIEATRLITGTGTASAPRVLILTTFDLDEYVFEALRAGASGFALKSRPLDELLNAIRVVAEGEALLAPSITRRLIAHFSRASRLPPERRRDLEQLTEHEREVLSLLARGLSNTELAETLHASLPTVKTHVSRILTKLGAGIAPSSWSSLTKRGSSRRREQPRRLNPVTPTGRSACPRSRRPARRRRAPAAVPPEGSPRSSRPGGDRTTLSWSARCRCRSARRTARRSRRRPRAWRAPPRRSSWRPGRSGSARPRPGCRPG